MKIKKAQVGKLVKKAVKAIDNKLVKSAGRDIEKSSTKGNFNAIPKSLQKPTTKIEKKIDARAKKIKKDNDSYDQSVWDSYQKNGGKTMKSMKIGGKIKKAQKGKTMSAKDSMNMYANKYDSLSAEAAKKLGSGKNASKDIKGANQARAKEKGIAKRLYGTTPSNKKGGVTKKKMNMGGMMKMGGKISKSSKNK
jgi:hypothetical protein